MKDKVNAIPLIGEIIKEELNKQVKTTVWLAEKLGCHRTVSQSQQYCIYLRTTIKADLYFFSIIAMRLNFGHRRQAAVCP